MFKSRTECQVEVSEHYIKRCVADTSPSKPNFTALTTKQRKIPGGNTAKQHKECPLIDFKSYIFAQLLKLGASYVLRNAPLVLKVRHLSGSAFCWVDIGLPEQALGWFPQAIIYRFRICYGR